MGVRQDEFVSFSEKKLIKLGKKFTKKQDIKSYFFSVIIATHQQQQIILLIWWETSSSASLDVKHEGKPLNIGKLSLCTKKKKCGFTFMLWKAGR